MRKAELAQEKIAEALELIEKALNDEPRYEGWYREAREFLWLADASLSFPLND